MGPHPVQEVESDARQIEQAVRDAFQAHVNPALARLHQEFIRTRAEIPKYYREGLSVGDFTLASPAGIAAFSEPIQPQTSNAVLIRRALIVAQSNAAFSVALTLAEFPLTIPAVAAGGGQYSVCEPIPLELFLTARDKRTVTTTAAVTNLTVLLMGEQLATTKN